MIARQQVRPTPRGAKVDVPFMLLPLFYAAGGGLAGMALYLFTRPFVRPLRLSSPLKWRFDPVPLSFLAASVASAAFSSSSSLAWANVAVLSVMVITYWMVLHQFSERAFPERFVRYWVTGALILAVLSLDGFLQTRTYATSAIVGKNGAGTLLATSLPLVQLYAIRGADRPVSRTALWLVPAALLLTMSLGAWVGMMASQALLLACPRFRKVVIITFSVLALSVGITVTFAAATGAPVRAMLESRLDPTNSSKVERTYIWRSAWAMWKDHPVTGVGLGSFSRWYPKYKLPQASEEEVAFAHNILLNTLAETGVLGLAALGALVWSWYRRGVRAARTCKDPLAVWACMGALTAFLVHQLFDGTGWSVQGGLGLWLVGGGLTHLDNVSRTASEKRLPASMNGSDRVS